MHQFLALLAAVAVSAVPLEQRAAASCPPPPVCSSACLGTQTIYKTHTQKVVETTCTTEMIYTKTHTAASTVTTTLSPACPTSTLSKRDVPSSASSISSSSSHKTTSTTSPIACPTYTCGCPSPTAKTTATTTTTVTKTKTKTEKVKTDTTTTATATSTPSVFYLESTYDSTFATNDPTDSGWGTIYAVTFDNPCATGSSALYTLNSTSGQLLLPGNGYIASNADCCGATGLPISFSDPSTLQEGLSALTCDISGEGLLECGLFNGIESWQVCGDSLLFGASHLCEGTTLRVVTPSFS